MPFLFEQATIIGVGLIGGSLARAARGRGLIRRFVGAGRGAANLERALALRVVDRVSADHREAVGDSDLVVIGTPVQAAIEVARAILPAMRPGAVLTDVGSVKGPFVRAVEGMDIGGVRFVGGHPIAGTEKSGVEASFPELFEGRRVILTPTPRTDPRAIEALKALWEEVGARVDLMDPGTHDRILADISHLPHLVAYALVDAALKGEGLPYAAGGFRDFTRIASSSPEMWREICLDNREALLASLGAFEAHLAVLRRAVEAGDGRTLDEVFRRAKAGRDGWLRDKGWA
ncbi:MAG: prephenate dehydrogenase/arogenate dehydrogenase family protein [Candidatus Tectomicrobia bacterium]|uniref:prephenate dehydrogenase n=1 Tax=Tectimicrobiota bacterium TaxID=2528274 RepID=A0A932MRG8_UNCTE|nr:prephenate dehydrogenase/arogenate dehydrogenase family protein [Candidatus Tectomicrobia bacterium]